MNNTQQAIWKLKKSVHAVSPIIATLMLVVITVAAAGAFYLWQTNWQSQQTNGIQQQEVVQQHKLTIGGSTTVYPFSVQAASLFEKHYDNLYTVDIQQGGSGAGIKAVGTGLVDIGAASRPLAAADNASYPGLIQTKIGYGAVVMIISQTNTNYNVANRTYQPNEIKAVYMANTGALTPGLDGIWNNADDVCNIPGKTIADFSAVRTTLLVLDPLSRGFVNWINLTNAGVARPGYANSLAKISVYDRADDSGTEATFVEKFMGLTKDTQLEAWKIVATHATGNEGVVAGVKGDASSIGFCDYGFAKSPSSGVTMLKYNGPNSGGLDVYQNPYNTGFEGGVKVFESQPTAMYQGARALYYITMGQPTGLAKLYITFCLQPQNNQDICTASGCITFY